MSNMTFVEFKKRWESSIREYDRLRRGQRLMHTLHSVWPEEYNRLSSLDYYDEANIDCFYVDDLIPNTLDHLERKWKNYPH